MTLTTTPAVKATNGLPPVGANSRSRVVNPILRKQKVNAQVRSAVIGATRAGLTVLVKSPYEALPTAQVMTIDAIRKPMTNFGKRHQIWPASTGRPVSDFSQRVTERTASTNAQIPIHMSRPITLISV